MADGARHSMRYVAEVVPGTTPATPAFKPIRHVTTTLGLSKETLQSEELRDDRQIVDFRHGARQVGGDIGIELSYGSFDDILEALLGGTWTSSVVTGINLAAAVGSFTRTVGSFLTDGLNVGDVVSVAGFTNAGNNGLFKITNLVALTATVTRVGGGPTPMVVEALAAGRTMTETGATLKAGILRRTFTIERFFADLLTANKPYHRFTGVEFNTLALAINANAMITGTIGVLGLDNTLATTAIAGATVALPTTTSPLDSFTGTLTEGGTVIAVVTEIALNLDNGMAPRFVVGSKTSIKPSIGRSNVTGTITAYFEDSTLLDKFINETETSLNFSLPDGAGNAYNIILPRLKYTGGQPDVTGEGPIVLSMPFQALRDATSASNILIERVPA